MKMSESDTDNTTSPTDVVVAPTKGMKQIKLQLTVDGVLHENDTIYLSDFNIISRYDIYDEEKVDDIESQLVLQYTKTKSHVLDLYFYDKSKTKEYRYWMRFDAIDNLQNEIDHDKGYSIFKIIVDNGKEFSLKNCPVEIVSWLANFLLSL
jgi:hypothetical protein